jgi:hypothetical protein
MIKINQFIGSSVCLDDVGLFLVEKHFNVKILTHIFAHLSKFLRKLEKSHKEFFSLKYSTINPVTYLQIFFEHFFCIGKSSKIIKTQQIFTELLMGLLLSLK